MPISFLGIICRNVTSASTDQGNSKSASRLNLALWPTKGVSCISGVSAATMDTLTLLPASNFWFPIGL